MDLRFVRITFVIITALVGSQVMGLDQGWTLWVRIVSSGTLGLVMVLIEGAIHRVGHLSVRGLSAAVFGLLLGLLMSKLAGDAIGLLPLDPVMLGHVRVALTWTLCYLCMATALRGRDEFNIIIPYVRLARKDRGEDFYLVDTSAIIDGRLLDLCKARFIEGRIGVPSFVLKELQTVADSSDSIKRSRGRRGLDVLNQLRELPTIDVRVHEEDLPAITEIDSKLVKLAQILGTRIITNDFNLNKIAEVQGVSVLNVNELSQALRPVVLPGEALEVKPIKEGKEPQQAVAYLDDGTMVVVENGRSLIGQRVKGIVTSVLQTAAGRMIFVRAENGPPVTKR